MNNITPDKYLAEFLVYLKHSAGENLAGVIIYGSYIKGYFDSEKSDYDLIVIFKDQTPDLKAEIADRFPRISLQIYANIEKLQSKIEKGSWGTYTLLKFNPIILIDSSFLQDFLQKIKKYNFNPRELEANLKEKFVRKLQENTELANTLNGFELNKFFNAALNKKLQILYYLQCNKFLLKLHDLLEYFKDEFIDDSTWILKVDNLINQRSEELVNDKNNYLYILRKADKLIINNLN